MPVIDEEPEQEENQQELHEEQPKQENPKYNRIRQMTEEIIEKEHNLETMGEIIKHLKDVRKTLKHKIAEMEEKINQNILNNEEPKDKVIEDIKRLRKIIEQQKEKRKEVKQMIKTYKKNKKIAKYMLQQAKETRDNEIDEMEL